MGTNALGGLGVRAANLYAAIDDRLPIGLWERKLKFIGAVHSPYYRRNVFHFKCRVPGGEEVHLEDFMDEFPSKEFIGALLLLLYDGQHSSRECPHGYDWEWCPKCNP